MLNISSRRIIHAAPAAVWDVLARYMHIDEIAPSVVSVDAISEAASGLGARRRCHFENGSSLVEEVVEWRPGRGYRIKGSDFGTMPVHGMMAAINLEPMETGGTCVSWAVDCKMKYGPVGWVIGQALMRPMMGKVLNANLRALEVRVQAGAVPVARLA